MPIFSPNFSAKIVSKSKHLSQLGRKKWRKIQCNAVKHLTSGLPKELQCALCTWEPDRSRKSGIKLCTFNVRGSRLWSHFSAIFVNFFGEKIGVFLKNQCYDQVLAKKLAVVWKKRQFSRQNFARTTNFVSYGTKSSAARHKYVHRKASMLQVLP
jgi:hypothetical protein